MIQGQLGRRNLTEEQKAYLRGKRYEAEKSDKKENLRQNAPKGQNVPSENTAERLAAEYKVTGKTIKRDADFANAVDAIAETVGEEARSAILKRDSGLTKQDVAALP